VCEALKDAAEKVVLGAIVLPQRLKPALKKRPVIAALKRCATQNRSFSAACERRIDLA
jgi:hypothetical protein